VKGTSLAMVEERPRKIDKGPSWRTVERTDVRLFAGGKESGERRREGERQTLT
jgi:hypothetical protein